MRYEKLTLQKEEYFSKYLAEFFLPNFYVNKTFQLARRYETHYTK